MNTTKTIREHILKIGEGEPFTSAELLAFGARASVDQALCRFVKEGTIERVSRGVFVRPTFNRYVGKVRPTPEKIARALARASGATIQVHGAEAALRLGLTTQAPTQSIFYTSGPSRHLQMGKLRIVLKHANSKKLAAAGTKAGLAIAALRYLGKEQVTPKTISTIRKHMLPAEFEQLKTETSAMPAWMADAIYHFEHDQAHA